MPQANFAYDFTFRITGDREVVAALDTMIMKGKEVVEGTRSTSQAMGAFSDELARTMKRFVTSQKDAARVSIEFLKTSNEVVSNLSAQSKAIMEQARRRGELYDEEVQQLLEINAKIQQHTDLIQKNSASLNVNSREFEIHNRVIASNTSQMRQIDEFTDRYSSSVVRAKAAQQEFNSKLSHFKSIAQVAVNEMKILANDVEAGRVSTEVGAASWEMYTGRIEQTISQLREYINTQELSAEEMAKATSVLANLTQSLENAQRGYAGTGSTMRGMNKVTSGANQLMLSFGDIVQDSAQFSFGFAQGARAIGNNIAFAAEQFVIMQANMAAANGQAATLGATLRALGSSLLGPIGVVVAINAVVTGVTMWATAQSKATQSTDEYTKYVDFLSEAIKKQNDEVQRALELLGIRESILSDRQGSVALRQELDDLEKIQGQLVSSQQIRDLDNKIIRNTNALTQASVDGDTERVNQLQEINNQLISERESLQNRFDFEEKIRESVNQRITTINEELKLDSDKLYMVNLLEKANQDLYQSEEERLRILGEEVKAFEEMVKPLNMARIETVLITDGLGLIYDELTPINQIVKDIEDSIDGWFGDRITDTERYLSEIESILGKFNRQQLSESLGLDIVGLNAKDAEQKLRDFIDTIDFSKLSLEDTDIVLRSLDGALKKIGETSEDNAIKFSDGFSMISSGVSNFIGSLTSLNQANATQSEAAAKKQFETQKKLSYASSVVAGAEAFVKALDEEFPFNFILGGLIAASTAAQLATISNQQFNYSGGGQSGSSSRPSFGFKMNEIEGPQTFRTPEYVPENQQMQPKLVINQELKADRKQLYILNKLGEEEYRQIKV